MRVYLGPIIIIALLVAALIFFVSCSAGFRGSMGANTLDIPMEPQFAVL